VVARPDRRARDRHWQVADRRRGRDGDTDVEALDTTEGEKNTTVYVEGEFNEDAVLYSYSDAADDWREKLAGYGIYLRAPLNTSGY
jgi:hypothetical protein